ncbi:hypothetical protein ElyMa_007040900 [Elysia marginata]|uniref:Uncharacterized protein n=1 Tax=Elysia marginata TaxID=1093978 RepID=A0AAV4JUR0_9GAST|nr:hypothetical protein ElyMa_007040900 [Elysia marginata]
MADTKEKQPQETKDIKKDCKAVLAKAVVLLVVAATAAVVVVIVVEEVVVIVIVVAVIVVVALVVVVVVVVVLVVVAVVVVVEVVVRSYSIIGNRTKSCDGGSRHSDDNSDSDNDHHDKDDVDDDDADDDDADADDDDDDDDDDDMMMMMIMSISLYAAGDVGDDEENEKAEWTRKYVIFSMSNNIKFTETRRLVFRVTLERAGVFTLIDGLDKDFVIPRSVM